MKITEINSISEFHQAIREHWDKHYVYRGENSDKYQLHSKIGRDQSKNSQKNDQAVEKTLLESFKRSAIPYLSYNPINDWDWLSIAQHHGLHTRLLDWSSNPLAAVFFAVHGEHYGDTVLYVFNSSDLKSVDENISPFNIPDIQLFRPRALTTRITSQAGLFTVHPNPSEIFTIPSLERIVIKASCKIELDIVLYTYNIDDKTMFPDLDGLARSLNATTVWQ